MRVGIGGRGILPLSLYEFGRICKWWASGDEKRISGCIEDDIRHMQRELHLVQTDDGSSKSRA